MNYPDSVEYLYSLGNEIKALKFGLENITAVLRMLGDPHGDFRIVHIAGTNGKGSTSAMVESAVRASGLLTGLYTSPHLIEPTERIQVAGKPVSRDEFADAFNMVHSTAERMLAAGELEYHPTYFETVTAMAFVVFRLRGVHTAVLEVGLGGRLDATNVVSPAVCAVTQVDYDHEAWLGTSIESIACEKAGILKWGVPVVFARQRPEADTVLTTRARELDCRITRTEEYGVSEMRADARGSCFATRGLHIRCPLAGEHQVDNALTAIAVLDQLGVSDNAIETGILATRWPARLETVSMSPEIILDGAHNPAGARALAQYIRRYYAGRPIWIIYGAMRDKSVQEITELLFPLAEKIILTAPSTTRALRPEVLEVPGAIVVPDVRAAIDLAREAPPNAAVFITGSLYLAGEARLVLVK
jgi:dihydrofolate synthase/folylpolyglutamate synthase